MRQGNEAMPFRPAIGPAAPPGSRILIVDDNRDAADSLGLLLGLDGHDVRVAYAGRQALETAKEFLPDVAILDLGLPDLSGYDVAQLMRQDPLLQRVALIALTGWGQEEHKQRARDAGFDFHLTKPVDLDRLAAVLSPDANR
jgi:DNA-binding response OmpR family regulator